MSRVWKSPVAVRDTGPTSSVGRSAAVSALGCSYERVSRAVEQQVLPFVEPRPLKKPVSVTPMAVRRLWFCIYLPDLSLQACYASDVGRDTASYSTTSYERALRATEGLAIVEEQHGIHRVLQVDSVAAAAGIMPGQSANAALALLPDLRLEERSPVREQQVLEALATWMERFSSFVSIAGKNILLLEIAGSLRLFDGLPNLRQQVSQGLIAQGFSAALAIAPTPLAATWLARAGQRSCIRAQENIAPALRQLPLSCLDWPAGQRESLAGMGISSIGDCLRLPREGFARRFGTERLLELDRALGRLPDPRDSWRSAERFCADYEMLEEQSDCELLRNICRELLLSHEQFLLTRQLGTQRLCFSFFHLKSTATELRLGSALAERSLERWFDLLKIRFEQLRLPEPVIAVRLRSGLSQPLQAETAPLCLHSYEAVPRPITGKQRRRYSVAQLAERLVACIGEQSVNAVTTVAEHRPEYAWKTQSPLAGSTRSYEYSRAETVVPQPIADGIQRPLWMLPEPAMLAADSGYPLHKGSRLTLLEGPERLETGWWDEQSVCRDYYTAVNGAGIRLWVFRKRQRTPNWYLHGIFG